MANLILGFVMDIIIFMGTALGVAMSATVKANGEMQLPPWAVVLFCLTVAVVQAGRRWDSKTSASPVKTEEVIAVRTPDELAAQGKAREDAITAIVERALKARAPVPVAPPVGPDPEPAEPRPTPTPRRVDPPPPVVTGPGVTRVPRERDLPGGT